MLRHTRSEIALASGLAWTAGYVDAVGFLHLGGYFVSFMTGNSTRAGASVADMSLSGFLQAFGLIAAFFLGVVAASALRRVLDRHRRPAICVLSAAVLGAAWASTAVPGAEWVLAPALAASMGLLNAVFERGGEVSIGITYMTGTLVKLGQKVTGCPVRGARQRLAPVPAALVLADTGIALRGRRIPAAGACRPWPGDRRPDRGRSGLVGPSGTPARLTPRAEAAAR